MSISATSILVSITRKETVKTVETAGAGKNSKKSGGEYPEYFVKVLCIRYPITFWKKFVLVLALLDSNGKINAIYPTFA